MIYLLLFLVTVLTGTGLYHTRKKMPAGLSVASPEYAGSEVRFLCDLSWEEAGALRHKQQIFQEILDLISNARRYILVDMFLYNDLMGKDYLEHRNISGELTEALVQQKEKYPDLFVVVMTDPVNIVYGGYCNPYLECLKQAGINIVMTNLDVLRDSNIFYSPFWRLFIKPFGSGKGKFLPNPLGQGTISLRSYFRMLNFKANHRKIVVADHGETLKAVVTSGNIHDGSSLHGNVAISFSGQTAIALWRMEGAVIRLSSDIEFPEIRSTEMFRQGDRPTLQLVSEGKIKKAILAELARAGMGDKVFLVLFYLSDWEIINAVKETSLRGGMVHVVLDPNKDAFGRKKSGIPNRQAASELVKEGVAVRWGRTYGEQLHSKMMLVDYSNGVSSLLIGSANYTRRNLDDFNMEMNVLVRGKSKYRVFVDARGYCSLLWNGDQERAFSVDYRRFADSSITRRLFYRFVEATGWCTF